MRKFLSYFSLFYLLPVALYASLILLLDPLKCFRVYKDYYKGSFISPNRENVVIQLFEQVHNRPAINSFILGNSCSHAFKIKNWENYLPKGSKGFHLDAYRETIYGIFKKLDYLDRSGNRIDNALIVIDESVFSKKFDSYMYVIPKKLDPEHSSFYSEHLKVLTSVKFMTAYAYYSVFRKNSSLTEEFKFTEKQPQSDNSTGDLFYLPDTEIRNDSVSFFNKLSKEDWVQRKNLIDLNGNDSYEGITRQNTDYLKKIAEILKRHKTYYKIIINPLYNQEKMPSEMVQLLNVVFGADNIYDMSGVNAITTDYRNYYDGIHYRPIAADKMLQIVYLNKQ